MTHELKKWNSCYQSSLWKYGWYFVQENEIQLTWPHNKTDIWWETKYPQNNFYHSSTFISVNTFQLSISNQDTPLFLLLHWSIFGRSQQSMNLLRRDFLIEKEVIITDAAVWRSLVLNQTFSCVIWKSWCACLCWWQGGIERLTCMCLVTISWGRYQMEYKSFGKFELTLV